MSKTFHRKRNKFDDDDGFYDQKSDRRDDWKMKRRLKEYQLDNANVDDEDDFHKSKHKF